VGPLQVLTVWRTPARSRTPAHAACSPVIIYLLSSGRYSQYWILKVLRTLISPVMHGKGTQ
jgi:hypothetical protein